MAFNSAHWSINYVTKKVTNTDSGSGTRFPSVTSDQSGVGSCLAFFQWLADEFAKPAQMDDPYPIVSDTPTVYKWVNGWGFGDEAEDPKYLTGGDFTSADGLKQWNSVFTIGSVVAGTQIAIYQNDAEITPWWDTDNIDVLILVKDTTFIQSDDTSGTPADGGIWLYTRKFGDFYNHGFVNLVNGRAPIGLDTAVDTNNQTLEATVQAQYDNASFTITFGTVARDLNNGAGAVNYDVEVACNGLSMAAVYEVMKLATQYGSGTTLNGDSGDEYRSASEGVYAEVKGAPFGTLAGTTLFGAQGVWFSGSSDSDFSLIDASGTTQAPPNLQLVNANHPNLSGTNILVAESSGGLIIKTQYTIASTTATTIVGNGTPSINADKTPLSGTVKVGDVKYAYTAFDVATETFSGVSPSPSGETGGFYVPLLDVTADAVQELSANLVYNSDITVVTSVRKLGFKPYDVETTFGSAGLAFTPILAVDPQSGV
jgi:hypothetical protein